MFLLLDNIEKKVSTKDLVKVAASKGIELDLDNPLIFRLPPRYFQPDPENNNMIRTPVRKGVPVKCNVTEGGVTKKLQYYTTESDRERNGSVYKVYSPRNILFLYGEIILDLSGNVVQDRPNDVSLAYFLIANHRFGKKYVLYQPEQVSLANLKRERDLLPVQEMLLNESSDDYLRDADLSGALGALGIPGSMSMQPAIARDKLYAAAKKDPTTFLQKVSSKAGKTLNSVQVALDLKLLFLFENKFYFCKDYTAEARKREKGDVLYEVPIHLRGKAKDSFVDFLLTKDTGDNLEIIQDLLKDTKK